MGSDGARSVVEEKLLGRGGRQMGKLGVLGVVVAALTLLGVMMLVVALVNFLQNRRTIDNEQFHPHVNFAIVLTLLASLIGILLAGYLLFTA